MLGCLPQIGQLLLSLLLELPYVKLNWLLSLYLSNSFNVAFEEGKYAVLSAASFHVASDYKVNECPALGVPSPTYTASIALIARPDNSWVANGQNYQVYDVQVSNVGDKKIKALNVIINTGSATITQQWNLNEVVGEVYGIPECTRDLLLVGLPLMLDSFSLILLLSLLLSLFLPSLVNISSLCIFLL